MNEFLVIIGLLLSSAFSLGFAGGGIYMIVERAKLKSPVESHWAYIIFGVAFFIGGVFGAFSCGWVLCSMTLRFP